GGVSSFGGANSVGAASFPGALGAQSGGTPTIPPRPLRTPTESAAANDIPMTKDQVALLIEAQRLKGGPPLPPTHLTSLLEVAQQEAGQGNANPFPRLPTPGGPPPLPGR